MTFVDVEIYIQKQLPDLGYPVDITVDGLRRFPRGYLPAGAQPPTPGDANFADEEYGQKLFRWLFANRQLAENWSEIRGDGRSRRIRLYFDQDVAELHRWPWEALCEPPKGLQPARSLAADPNTPFSRFLAVNAPLLQALARRPIRMLVVAPQPTDFAERYPPARYPDMAVIDPAQEFQALQNALQPLIQQNQLRLELFQQTCSLTAIADALSLARAENQGYHILHIITHGFYYDEKSFLLLADKNNLVQHERDQAIVAQLGPSAKDDENGLRLIFLAACESAKRSSSDAFRGLAPQLMAAGLPAVIAMQDYVTPQTARQFAAKFYRQLLHHGQVDLAANEARQVILAARQPGPVIPVLFLRQKEGQLWPASQVKPLTVFLSHALQPGDAEYAAVQQTVQILEDSGFQVTFRASGAPPLLDEMTTCDAAVMLVSERTWTTADNWMQIEARLLCWRRWLDRKNNFRLIVLGLGEIRHACWQEGIGPLLWAAGVAPLSWATGEELANLLRTRLADLQQIMADETEWQLINLRQRVARSFHDMGFPETLQRGWRSLAQCHGLAPLPNEDLEQRWARAILWRGPSLLRKLYEEFANKGPVAKRQFINLLPTTVPAWVDMTAAAQLIYLAKSGEQTPGSFYLKRTECEDPVLWYAQAYAARACGQAVDATPCLLVAAPLPADNDANRLNAIRLALKEALREGDRALWSEMRRNVLGKRIAPDESAESALVSKGNEAVDKVIQGCVAERARGECPVLLLLSGATAYHTELLTTIRTRFGPVCFFFMGDQPPPSGLATGACLTVDFPEEEASQAYEDWDILEHTLNRLND